MEILWMLGGPKVSRVYVNARAAYVKVGPAHLESAGGRFPMIAITYPPLEHSIVHKIASAMKAKDMVPQVHLWDLDKPDPEVAVWFGLDKPKTRLLQEIGLTRKQTASAGIAELMPCGELFTLAEANTFKAQAEEFMELFKYNGFLMVGIAEENGDQERFNSTEKFMVETVIHKAPTIEP